jgi:hypothetical protein
MLYLLLVDQFLKKVCCFKCFHNGVSRIPELSDYMSLPSFICHYTRPAVEKIFIFRMRILEPPNLPGYATADVIVIIA